MAWTGWTLGKRGARRVLAGGAGEVAQFGYSSRYCLGWVVQIFCLNFRSDGVNPSGAGGAR